ncbi:hypothetical protein ILUMI_10732, partial [Ignelater luminosus]
MTLLLVLQLAFYFLIFLCTLWFFLYFKYEKYLKKIPGPRPIPLFGNAFQFRNLSEFLSTILRLQEQYGGMIKMKLGFRPPTLLVTDTKAFEYFLGSTKIIEKSEEYNYLHSWLGTGLLTSA